MKNHMKNQMKYSRMKLRWLTPAVSSPRASAERNPPKQKTLRIHPWADAQGFLRRRIKVLVTGGHVTPALAVIEEMRRRYPRWEIVFVGRYYALEGKRVISEEYRLAKYYHLRFLPLTSGRLTRYFSFSLLKLPWGVAQAMNYIGKEDPQVVVSFGGYLAVPVAIAAWVSGIPVITHEQTRVPGLANRFISSLARRVLVSFADQVGQFSPLKVIYTGLPIRRGIFTPPQKVAFPIETKVPLIFISGGATGAQSVNTLVYPSLGELTLDFMIVHQVGRLSYDEALERKRELPPAQARRYLPLPYLDIADYSYVLNRATVVVGRSGANTVGEIAALGKVALFIPLPWSGGGEQLANATYLASRGSAVVLPQKEASPASLVNMLRGIMANIDQFQKQAKLAAKIIKRDASRRVVSEVVKYVSPRAAAN